jgi:hypothetical protein
VIFWVCALTGCCKIHSTIKLHTHDEQDMQANKHHLSKTTRTSLFVCGTTRTLDALEQHPPISLYPRPRECRIPMQICCEHSQF